MGAVACPVVSACACARRADTALAIVMYAEIVDLQGVRTEVRPNTGSFRINLQAVHVID